MAADPAFAVQICHVQPDQQFLEELFVAPGTTIAQAISLSGILQRFPGMQLVNCRVGIYGKLKTVDTLLRPGDRVEIYRPLVADPMDARRRRAGKRENRQHENKKAR